MPSQTENSDPQVEEHNIDLMTASSSTPLEKVDSLNEDYDDINHLSFRAVEPINVEVKTLSISVNIRPSITSLSTLQSVLKGAKESRKILDDVNAVMPVGKLMAIIGGSGSGKVIKSCPHLVD